MAYSYRNKTTMMGWHINTTTPYSSLPVPQYMFHIPRAHTIVATVAIPSGITTLVILSVLHQNNTNNNTNNNHLSKSPGVTYYVTNTNHSRHVSINRTPSSHEHIPLPTGKTSGPVQSETYRVFYGNVKSAQGFAPIKNHSLFVIAVTI